MPARVVTITGLGDFRQLQAELERTGVISAQSSKSIADSAATAGEAAAAQAKEMGASADEQEAAAARAAAAYVDGAERMTQAQKAAAAAAAAAADANGAAADEIVAASARAVEAQRAIEEASLQTAGAAEAAGVRLGTAFDEGTSRAGNALTRLGETGASWGIPLSGSLTKMGKQFDEADSKTEKFGSALASTGKLAVTAGLVGFGVAAVEGVKGAAALQKQMTMLETQAGASSKQVKTLTGDVLNMAGEVGAKPQELAEGMYHVVSALNATTAPAQRVSTEYGVMKAAAEGAQVGGANIVDVTNALDAAVISGLPGLGSYTHAMGALNTIVGAGDMTMQNLADALGTGLLGPMKNFGVSLQDIGGALAVFGDNNIRGAAAATKLSSAIRIMAAPSKTAAGYLAEVGISATELGNDIRNKGLVDALEDLKQHLEDSGDTATQQMRVLSNAFGGRQAMGVQILLAQLERLKDKVADVSHGGADFGSDWQKRTENLSYQLDKLRDSLEADADRLGFFLIPKLEEAGSVTGKVIQWFEKNKVAAEALGLVVGGILSAAVGAFAAQKAVAFYTGLQKMWTGMQTLASSVTSSVSTIIEKFSLQDHSVEEAATTTATETQGIAASYGTLSPAAAEAASGVQTADEALVASADTTAAGVDAAMGATGIGAVLGGLGLAAVELEQHWGTVMKDLESTADATANAVIQAVNKMRTAIEALATNGLSLLGQELGLIGHIIPSLSEAGKGPSSGGMPTLVAPGDIFGGETSGPGITTGTRNKYGLDAELAGAKYGINPKILLADIEQESSGIPVHSNPSSSTPGIGNLTQFEPGTAKEYGVEFGTGAKEILSQIMGQAHYLHNLGGEKNIKAALEGYNSGTVGDPISEGYADSVLAKAGITTGGAGGGTGSITGGEGKPEPLTATQEKAQEKAESKQEEAVKRAEEEVKKHLEAITKSGETLLKKYEANVQSSTPAAIERSLGISTTGKYKSIPGMVEKAAQTGKRGPLERELRASASASEAGKQESKLIAELKATHQKGLAELASKLTDAHREALATLASEMVSTEQTKLGEQLKIQATEEKDRTTLQEHSAADQLNIIKAEQTQQTDAMKAAAQAISDATQSMTDSFSALTQSIEDQSKVMAASSNEVVEGIRDQTNIEVAILGERGLYGLNLIAQKQEVQLDEMKASYDQQIAQAQREEATLAANWQTVVALDEQVVDQDKTIADAQEAAAQAHLDAVTVAEDQQIAAAQAAVDSAQLHADQLVGNAELKVLAAANAGKQKEAEAAAGLKLAEGKGEAAVRAAEKHLKGEIEPDATAAINAASNELTKTTESWSNAIKRAEQELARAQGEGHEQLARAQQTLQGIEDKAAQEEAKKEGEIAVTKEKASTQYAGSGLVVNITGINPTDSAEIASQVGWVLKTQVPA